jgi:UDP-galactopyranose mutase
MLLKQFNAPINRLPDVICLSHLRWNSVFQRPQHLMSRYARTQRVYFFEQPVFADCTDPQLRVEARDGVTVVAPHLPQAFTPAQCTTAQRAILDRLIASQRVTRFVLWYYAPLALHFAEHLKPLATVYDCIDEPDTSTGATIEGAAAESTLLRRADVIFTRGQPLDESQAEQHRHVQAMPGSGDAADIVSWDRTWSRAAGLLNAVLTRLEQPVAIAAAAVATHA